VKNPTLHRPFATVTERAPQDGMLSAPGLIAASCGCWVAAGIAGLLTFVMGKRFLIAYKVMPAGVVAGLSAFMVLYYLYNMLSGGNPKRKTDKAQ
jgi:hypothetical protein